MSDEEDDDDTSDEDAHSGIDFAPKTWHQPSPSVVEQALGPRGLPVQNSPELARVLALPRRAPVVEGSTTALAMMHIANEKYSKNVESAFNGGTCRCREIDPQRKSCITHLNWVQSWSLWELEQYKGLIAQAAVGIGKTAIDILAPLALRDCPLCLLLIPPTLRDQIIVDYQLIAEHFHVPTLVVHTSSKKTWRSSVRTLRDGSPAPTLHVFAYTGISGDKNSDWLERLRPDAIICDEIDALKSASPTKFSTRVLRILRFFRDHYQTTRFCGWTGSLTDSSLSEFAHLSALALREGSPLPLDPMVTAEWGRCLDAIPNPAPPGALIRLLNPGEPFSLANVRRAFQRRLSETRGFVIVTGAQVITRESDGSEIELDIREKQAPPLPPIIEEALAKVRNSIRPDTLGGSLDDEILVDPMEQARCAREVASGMFYRFVFVRGEAKDDILAWYSARKEWNSELRAKMFKGELQLDSPKLLERAAMRAWGDAPKDAALPEWRAEAWPSWRDIRDRVTPVQQAVRLHPYLVEDAMEWALSNRGVVWYANKEYGKWCAEVSGLPLHGGGPDTGERLRRERGDRSIIASIHALGRGHNGIQFIFNEQLVAQPPSSATRWEQLLGRMYRRGQSAETVVTWLYQHVPEYISALEQAIRRGEYVEAVTGAQQKLLRNYS